MNLATNEAKLAPSLTAAQRAIDDYVRSWESAGQRWIAGEGKDFCSPGSGCGGWGSCDVVRNDGEILALHCHGMLNSGTGGPMQRGGKTWVYERRGDAFVELALKDMFPGAVDKIGVASPEPTKIAELVEDACNERGTGASGGEQSDDGFDEVYPYAMNVGLAASGGRWQSWKGQLPYTRGADFLGCGPLGKLRQFSADTKGEGDAWPLEVSYVSSETGGESGRFTRMHPRFHSADPRRAPLAERLNAELEAVANEAEAKKKDTYLHCELVTSLESIVSWSCFGATAMHRTYRLADGSPVGPADVFAAQGATKAAVKHCYGKYLSAPGPRDEYTKLTELPPLSADEMSRFVLVQSGVFVELPMDAVYGAGRTEKCLVPYGTLSTSLAALAKPAAKP